MRTIFQIKTVTALLLATLFIFNTNAHANELEDYCTESGGVPDEMQVQIHTAHGIVTGQSKMFCNFELDSGYIAVGLETFASDKPSIAATFMKKMGEITGDSPLFQGNYANPSVNVCKNIGGAAIGFVASGGFANKKGENDICVFGDGSMVSGWSLIYMVNHREGYDVIKDKVKSAPLEIYIPVS